MVGHFETIICDNGYNMIEIVEHNENDNVKRKLKIKGS